MRRTSALHRVVAIWISAGLLVAGARLKADAAATDPGRTAAAQPASCARPLGRPRGTQVPVDPTWDLDRRLLAYSALKRRLLDGPGSTLAVTSDVARIRRTVDGLAAALKMARASARPGDIFSPAIAEMIRFRIAGAVAGQNLEDVIAALEEDEPLPRFRRPVVNARYPALGPVATIPPSILRALPRLPAGLQYGFLHTTLILWDLDAGLIVDVVPNAVPAPCSTTAFRFLDPPTTA